MSISISISSWCVAERGGVGDGKGVGVGVGVANGRDTVGVRFGVGLGTMGSVGRVSMRLGAAAWVGVGERTLVGCWANVVGVGGARDRMIYPTSRQTDPTMMTVIEANSGLCCCGRC